jgi:hypothetical protein
MKEFRCPSIDEADLENPVASPSSFTFAADETEDCVAREA